MQGKGDARPGRPTGHEKDTPLAGGVVGKLASQALPDRDHRPHLITAPISSLETSDPGASPSGRDGPERALRGLRATRLSGRRPAPIHPAPSGTAPPGGGGQAPPATPRYRPSAPPLGLEDRACHRAKGGLTINRKRTQRLWRDEGLRRPAPCRRKRTRPPGGGQLLRAQRPNHVWALDFQFDETADRRRLKLLNVVDEHTREALAMRVGRTCDADQVVGVIEALVAERGAPEHLRMDNGPELISWALRDWCRLGGAGTSYIDPGSPWENPFAESFNSRVRDELLNTEEFAAEV
ncbi:MAG TPA: DDE-type integrase/transposase/recombinase [Acidimicrobiales bacterium]|nr:DDE-type integrase/transposase/recombinase [Acidimicrobiales bacterium]